MIEIKGKVHDASKLQINPNICHMLKSDKLALLVLGRMESATINSCLLAKDISYNGKRRNEIHKIEQRRWIIMETSDASTKTEYKLILERDVLGNMETTPQMRILMIPITHWKHRSS